jgi:post-segregation antitoxin (ccd killing protein)
MQASLYQIRKFVMNALSKISNISHFTSNLASSISGYHISNRLDSSTRHNMLQMLDVSMSDGTETTIHSRFTKQRTDAWSEIRASARVTGSTLHNAIGLRELKAQKTTF